MTLVGVALGWTAASMVSGLFLGSLLHRFGGGAAPGWDPVARLDGTVVTPLGSHAASHHRRRRQ
jgi:hypothetical protein